MGSEELAGYCSVVRDLQDRYSDKIRIHMGLEVEYYPALFSQLIPVLQDQGIEYLLLGQHFIGNEQNQPYSGAPTVEEAVLRQYCAQSMDAMQTGLFTYFAHPDLIYYTDDRNFYRERPGSCAPKPKTAASRWSSICWASAKAAGIPGTGSGRWQPRSATM
jgi:histidinol-phosphatase (PHP family)